MNWLPTLAFAVLLLSIQYDASESALPTLSQSPWADPAKASTFMDCLLTKIVESEVFPQQEKDDLKSIMDTLMSAISGANARVKNNGAQLQAINMAIASSLAEIVVENDAGDPTSIAEKTQDLAGGLEQCFESVMGTIDRKFISEINDLISVFAKQAASEIKEPEDLEDPSSSVQEDPLSQPAAQPTPIDAGDEVPKPAPIDAEPETTGIEPEVSEPEPNDVGPQVPQTPPELISGLTNELANTSIPSADLRNGVPQQNVRTPLYPNRSSSSFRRSQSAANSYQSSQTFQGSSQTAGGYGGAYRGPQVSDLTPSNAGQPVPNGVGPQPASGRNWRVGNEITDASTRRTFLRNGVSQQTAPTAGYPDRSSLSSFQTTSQSADNTYQSSQTFQGSSQMARGYEGTYSGSQFSERAPIDVGPQVSQAAPEFISRGENDMADTSTRRAVLRNGVPQQTVPTAVYPNRLSSSSFQTSQSAENNYQSSRTFQGSSQTAGGYRGEYYRPQASEITSINAGPQVSQVAPTGVGPQGIQPAPERVWRVGNERGVPQQTAPTVVYPNRSSSSSFQTSQSADNTYQSSQAFQGSSQTAGGYRGTYFGPQFSETTPKDVGPQVSPAASEFISRGENDMTDTSTRRAVLRSGVPQQTVPTAVYPNRLSSSSFQTASQSAENTYQSSQTFQGSSQTASGYSGAYSGPQVSQPVGVGDQVSPPEPIDLGPQVSQAAPGRIWRVGNEMADTSTQRSILRSGVPQQTIPTAVYPNRSSSSSFQTSQSAANSYQSSQTFQGSSQTAGGYRGAYSGSQVSQPTPIAAGPQVPQPAPGYISREANKLADTSTRRAILRSGNPQQTVPTAVYPNTPSSSSFQSTSQSSDNTYQSSQTIQSSSQTASGYGGKYLRPKYSKPAPIGVGPQISQAPPIGVGPQISQAPPSSVGSRVSQEASRLTTRVSDQLVDTSTRRAVLRSGVPQQTVPIPVYPSRSSFQTTNQSVDKTYQSSKTSQSSSQKTDEFRRRYRRPQFFETTAIAAGPQVPQAAPGFISREANKLADTSTRRGVLRSGVSQQTVPTAMYPRRSSSSSFQTSQSAANSYQSSQTFQGSSQTARGYGRAYSGPQVSQPIPIGARPQISQAPPIAAAPADQGNGESCIAPLPEISVLPTLNSPNGLRSDSAGARINQLISAVLNAITPYGVDANALASSLQASVSNLRSSGMSASDAKLEVLLELIVGLLQIVSNAQIREINTTTASAVTDAAARCFELALA